MTFNTDHTIYINQLHQYILQNNRYFRYKVINTYESMYPIRVSDVSKFIVRFGLHLDKNGLKPLFVQILFRPLR